MFNLYICLSPCHPTAINCTECPDGWVHIGDHCFFLSNDTDGWLNSTLKCKDIGGHLAILTTKEEYVRISLYFKSFTSISLEFTSAKEFDCTYF